MTGVQTCALPIFNALSTLGGQQQTIAQNQQNYPLTKLASLAGLLQGASIPTSTKTTLCMSPYSALGTLGAGGLGLIRNLPGIKKSIGKMFGGKGGGGGGGCESGCCDCSSCCSSCCSDCCSACFCCVATGGSIPKKAVGGGIGCYSTRSYGALPFKKG